jgi:hypothetical protein
MVNMPPTLDQIVDVLDQHHQRATYGAVAGLLGRPATFLMSGIERAPRYSWIVNQESLKPTGYSPEQTHPALEARRFVLLSTRELAAWLEKRAPGFPAA